MKLSMLYLFSFIFITVSLCNAQQLVEIVKDFDGNEYHAIKIGNQIWLKENLKSLHYSDGTIIQNVVAYNSDESMANIYGRLYTWDAAMRNSNQEMAQGAAPAGYHIPTHSEWLELENYLGGATVAGGKMKDSGTSLWKSPNTGADNSSDFSALPGGEYDSYYSPNKFSLINENAVFWTSTEISSTKARERYLGYNSSASMIYDWFKVMKYSLRCIKNSQPTGVNDKAGNKIPDDFTLLQNFPNPFNPATTIIFRLNKETFTKLEIFDLLGRKCKTLVNEYLMPGEYRINFNADDLASSVYIYQLTGGNNSISKKLTVLK
jgi:uncharacterized protein (TIGR02145 family)